MERSRIQTLHTIELLQVEPQSCGGSVEGPSNISVANDGGLRHQQEA